MTHKRKRIVAINEYGLRIGEDHPNARLTNLEVDVLLELREELDENGKHIWSYGKLAEKFDIGKTAVRRICKGQSRCQTPMGYKTIYEDGEDG